MLLFTENEKKNVLVYTHQVTSTTLARNIYRRKLFKVDLTDISNRKFLFCLHHSSFTLQGGNKAQLLRHCEPISLLETARSLNEYILISFSYCYILAKLRTAILVSHICSSNSGMLQCKCQAMIFCILWVPLFPAS